MEETYNTEAIILDRVAFRERDVKLVVFSKDRGKLELVARGAKKLKSRSAGHIEPLTRTKLMVIRSRNEYDLLGTSCGDDFFTDIKDDLNKLAHAGRALKLVGGLSRPGENEGEEIYFLLKDFLEFLKTKEEADFDLIYNFFVLKLLCSSGFGPNLQTCADCGIKIVEGGNSLFALDRGGVICQPCKKESQNSLPLTDDCLKILRFGLDNSFGKLNNLKIDKELNKEINNKISSFLKYNF